MLFRSEKASLKESERIEKEIVELREMKVRRIFTGTRSSFSWKNAFVFLVLEHIYITLLTSYLCAQKKISTMTADEYFEKHPELKQKFDDEIRNDNWGY